MQSCTKYTYVACRVPEQTVETTHADGYDSPQTHQCDPGTFDLRAQFAPPSDHNEWPAKVHIFWLPHRHTHVTVHMVGRVYFNFTQHALVLNLCSLAKYTPHASECAAVRRIYGGRIRRVSARELLLLHPLPPPHIAFAIAAAVYLSGARAANHLPPCGSRSSRDAVSVAFSRRCQQKVT